MATIITYPHQLEYAEQVAEMTKEQFKAKIAAMDKALVYKMLETLSDELSAMLNKAKGENPETCKRILVQIRQIVFQWYLLDHIEHSPSNMLLFQLKNELKWYIDETRVIYESVNTFKSFDDMYNNALYYGTVEKLINDEAADVQKRFHKFCFEVWLQEKKNWKLEDDVSYHKLITKDNWQSYLAYQKEEKERLKTVFLAEMIRQQPTLDQLLSGNITTEQIREANNKHYDDLHFRLSIICYFEKSDTKIQLFNKGYEHYKQQSKLDYEEIVEAQKTNRREVDPHRTFSLIQFDSIQEASVSELEALFQEKFKKGKESGFKTEARFAYKELEYLRLMFTPYRKWFPILDQWFEFLEAKAQKSETPYELTSMKNVTSSSPNSYNDIFANKNWRRYISALQNTEPPLINEQNEFIGNAKKHKGVVCAWIRSLQYKGIIKQTISRAQLAHVLNNEIENFNLGKDGKTFDNVSSTFEKQFKEQLENLSQ